MEIHRPTPFHGGREFAKEVGIIVLGVLIALGAEQTVQALHHRDEVRHGEEALRDNFARFVQYKVELDQEAPCMAARAAQIRAIIDRAAVDRRLPAVGPIPQPYARPWQIDTWDAMVSSTAATYVPHQREILYSRIAVSAVDLYQDATAEWAEWGALTSLSGPARGFSDVEQAKARDTLARAVQEAALVHFIADNTVQRIVSTGLLDRADLDAAIQSGRGHTERVAEMCRPIAVGGR
ncbi:MAG: hypothetical protein JWP86_2468 [Phenylobacterium sp.]|nr:hypothetical protein [Phenylobacterium sp.]